MGLVITNHAAMRYAERIADRESLIDINTYVAKNKDKRTNKGKKRLQKIREAHKNVGSEPSESIIPGIND